MQLHSAQFPEERQVFRKANGVTKTLSVVVRKTYEVETDFIPEMWHQRLKIALAHDNISWEGDRYLGGVTQDGDYNIQWPEGVLHYPTAKAECKVQVTPFDATNSNCQTCEEASQLDLVDDAVTALYGEPLEEDTDYTASLADNDLICCYPAVFSLVSFNSDYLTTATINAATGVLSIHTAEDLVSVNGLLIATYRVTCPNGGYDEANVYADIEGTIVGCLAPTDLQVVSQSPTAIQYSWVEPFNDATYYYELYEGSLPVGTPLYSGTIDIFETVTVVGLDPNTEYYFQIRTVCYGSESNFIGVASSTIPESNICGQYEVCIDNGTGNPASSRTITWRDCNSELQSQNVFNLSCVLICALQTSPGVPVYINAAPFGTITYVSLC